MGQQIIQINQLRRAWSVSHGLHAAHALPPVDISRQLGWPRTLGGVDAYLAMAARNPQLQPSEVDAALVHQGPLQVLPAARSCMYIVPRVDAPRALRFGFEGWKKRTLADCLRAGVQADELERAVQETAKKLNDKPQTTDELRQSLPAGVIRGLGEVGKKAGKSTVFPDAIRWLESEGLAERTPADGHLRNERYVWKKPQENRIAQLTDRDHAPALNSWMAQHYFQVAAPGRVRDFADWAGIGQKDAGTAMAPLNLQQIAVEGQKEPYFLPQDRLNGLEDDTPAQSPRLLSLIDPLTDYRNGLQLLVNPRHHGVELPGIGGKLKPIRELNALWLRMICDGGEVIGVWDFDPDAKHVVTATFDPLPKPRQKVLNDEAERLTVLLRDTLKDARAYSLDSEKSLRQRAQFVRSVA